MIPSRSKNGKKTRSLQGVVTLDNLGGVWIGDRTGPLGVSRYVGHQALGDLLLRSLQTWLCGALNRAPLGSKCLGQAFCADPGECP